jgi:hypothetical protein
VLAESIPEPNHSGCELAQAVDTFLSNGISLRRKLRHGAA